MTIKCDHCRGSVGPNVYRYWRMQYCSAGCLQAYQRRLDTETVGKIGRLEFRDGDFRFLPMRRGEIRKDAA